MKNLNPQNKHTPFMPEINKDGDTIVYCKRCHTSGIIENYYTKRKRKEIRWYGGECLPIKEGQTIAQNKISNTTLWIVLLFIFLGCSSKELITKIDEIKIAPSVIETELPAKYDTVYKIVYGEKIVQKDTVIKVKFIPKEKKIYIYVKPDSVTFYDIDTVFVTRTDEQTFWENIKENSLYILVGAGLIISIFFLIRSKIL